ncbi:MAG: phage integrase SAM-like domain-containing protein, partial [Tannerellaceae bacterium]|nr:phage integrase SAM-like domain-containing protein [Tannerellaceae bacterium]
MATLRVYLKQANKKGEAPIYISFYINREKIEVPTKISTASKYFDPEKGIIKSNLESAKDLNLIISDIKAKITDIFVRFRLRKDGVVLTPSLFWEEYKNPGIYKNFYEFCTSYQQIRFNEIKESTQKKHLSCLNNLKQFKANLLFADMTKDFFRKFVLYLRKRKLKEVTINKHISVFRIYINDAIEKGLIKKDPTKGVKLRGHIESTVEA